MQRILLQINSVANAGSTGRIAEDIGILVMENGWNSFIAYGRMANPSKSNLIRIGTNWDVYKHVLKTRLLDRHGFGSINATRKFIGRIEQINPDIIHLHNIHGYYLNVELLFDYLKTKAIPVVWTLHDCWSFTGHCAYFSYIGCEKWKTECNKCPQIHDYPGSLFVDQSKPNFKNKKKIFTSYRNITLVPVSKWLGDLTANSFFNGSSIQVINNGIDLRIFKPESASDLKTRMDIAQKFVILGVAHIWTERKGLADFLKLSTNLKEDEIIILIGLTKDKIAKLPFNIIGLEKTESVAELAGLYSLADVFVNPTHEDNFPTTNLEALACGTPVITYNTGGSPEAVDNNTGFVVEQGDITGILHSIQTIKLKGKGFYSKACRERAVKLFNKEDRYMDYLKLYESLLI